MLTRNKVLSHAILIILLISALPLVVHFGSENVSAAPDTHTWDGGGADAFAGTHANWVSNIAPEAGDSVVFDAGALPCTWNLSITLNAFSMNVGYSGVVTQAVAFGCVDWSIADVGATFTGSNDVAKPLTVSGNFIRTDGGLTSSKLCIILTGTGKTYSCGTYRVLKMTVTGSYTVEQSPTALRLDNQGILTIVAGTTLSTEPYAGLDYLNTGTITGTGILRINAADWGGPTNINIALGTIECPVILACANGVAANITLTSTATVSTTSTLTVSSLDAAKTLTLDLSASNYALSCTDLTIGTRGILRARASTITASGNVDFSAGQYQANTSTVDLTGTTKTVKTANTNGGFYGLSISGTVSTLSSVNVSRNLTVDVGKTLTIGTGKTIDLNCSNGGTYSNLGTIAGTGTMEYSFSTADKTLAFGVVNAPIRVRAISTATANRIMTLSSDRILGSTLLVNSDHASNTMTIDARTVYLGAVGAITEGTRGDILYATFSFVSSPGYGGGVQTMHSYTYETNLSTTASPGQVYTFTSNATWLSWDSTDLAVYGTPDSVFGGHWYYVNISVADGMLSTYQNYTVLVVPVETLQDYIPLLMALLFGFGLLMAGFKYRELWILAGPVWIICGLTIFIPYGVVFLLVSVGLGIVLMFKGVSPYL